jgi:hypothetical protein
VYCLFLPCNSFPQFPGHFHLFLQRLLQPFGLPARLPQEIQRFLQHCPSIITAAAAALSDFGRSIGLFFGQYTSRRLPGSLSRLFGGVL